MAQGVRRHCCERRFDHRAVLQNGKSVRGESLQNPRAWRGGCAQAARVMMIGVLEYWVGSITPILQHSNLPPTQNLLWGGVTIFSLAGKDSCLWHSTICANGSTI